MSFKVFLFGVYEIMIMDQLRCLCACMGEDAGGASDYHVVRRNQERNGVFIFSGNLIWAEISSVCGLHMVSFIVLL